jgi:hypothetical protein
MRDYLHFSFVFGCMQDTCLKWTAVASLQFVLHNPDAIVSFLNYMEVGVHYLVLIALDE